MGKSPMDSKLRVWILTAVAVACWSGAVVTEARSGQLFDRVFSQFLRENGYRGGAVAAMRDGRLLLARGFGLDRDGREVTAHSKFPASSLAKSLTAVAVMRLVQDNVISLDDKVFGEFGILSVIKPWRRASVDPRLYDVTVEQLLRHTAGWDATKGPLYDPVLNTVYLDRGHTVPNIARDMGVLLPLDPETLISYVMSHPLTFTPGTNVAYSNMAYLVLGRVVGEASGMEYRDYVKKSILDPCGMWSTRLELKADEHLYEGSKTSRAGGQREPSMLDNLDPVSVDSALGWYSNVYDLMRFSRCTFETRTVLDDRHLELLLARPPAAPIQHDESWHCAGFRTNTRGVVWQDADLHSDDLILYHDLEHSGEIKAGLPDSWVVLLYDTSINHIRHYTRDLMILLEEDEEEEVNPFLYDLSDLHRHPMWEMPRQLYAPEYVLRYRVDEHHLSAYTAALRDEGFDLQWLTSYNMHHHHTYFLLVGRRVTAPSTSDRSQYDFIFHHGLDDRSLPKRKLQLEDSGYNMTQLHSYKSRSHDGPVSFAAVFHRDAFSVGVQMKYGTGHLPEPYEKLVQMYYEKKFYPLSQTVVHHDKEERFSFIFIKDPRDKITDFKHHYDLSTSRLAKVTLENAKAGLRLAYLNSYDISGRYRFSAIYTNGTHARGLLEIDQPLGRATEITISNLQDGLVPRYMVPYKGENNEFLLAIYYQEA